MATVEVWSEGGYFTSIELVDMQMPETIECNGLLFQLDMFRGIYTDYPFKTKQEYLESFDDDVPF